MPIAAMRKISHVIGMQDIRSKGWCKLVLVQLASMEEINFTVKMGERKRTQ